MKRILIAVAVLLSVGPVALADKASWMFSGDAGPEHWAQPGPGNNVCATGSHQSPIDLSGFTDVELAPIVFDYTTAGASIYNNGRTVQVDMNAGSRILIDGVAFALEQFHFHAPSEHSIDGQSFPMEAHLVHVDQDGHLVVVAVMVEEGAANRTLAQAWTHMPQEAGERIALVASVRVANQPVFSVSPKGLLPAARDYYRYIGSLTTPPCTEGVRWLIMKRPISASRAQIEAFINAVGHPNNRPQQPLQDREILE